MKVSKEGLQFIANFEGFYPNAYDDLAPKTKLTKDTKIKGVITIGYGTTKYFDGSKVKWNDTITKEKAWEYLETQVNQHSKQFLKAIKIKLTQKQFDALASFSYNCGAYAITNNKTLLNAINDMQWMKVLTELNKYVRSGGQVLLGLVRRREKECDMFLEGSMLVPQIAVDGSWGEMTTRVLQRYYKTTVDGVISGQPSNFNTNKIHSAKIGKGGSQLIRRMQEKFNTPVDGFISNPSSLIRAMQKKMAMTQTGVITSDFIKKMQTYINNGSL